MSKISQSHTSLVPILRRGQSVQNNARHAISEGPHGHGFKIIHIEVSPTAISPSWTQEAKMKIEYKNLCATITLALFLFQHHPSSSKSRSLPSQPYQQKLILFSPSLNLGAS